MSLFKTYTLGPVEVGFRIQPRFWGLGLDVIFEDYYRSAWITFGPFSVWIEAA